MPCRPAVAVAEQPAALPPRLPGTGERRWISIALGVLGLCLALFVAYAAGRISAGYSGGAAARALGLPDPALERAGARARELESKLAALEVARKVDQAAAAKLASAQEDLQSKIQEQSQELAFYRSIVAPDDATAGFRILKVQVMPGAGAQRFRLRIVLIQAPRPATDIAGELVVTMDGVRSGRAVSLPLGAAGRPLPYAFRSFQELNQDFELPADFRPVRLQLEARSRGAPTPVRHSVPWKVEPG